MPDLKQLPDRLILFMLKAATFQLLMETLRVFSCGSRIVGLAPAR